MIKPLSYISPHRHLSLRPQVDKPACLRFCICICICICQTQPKLLQILTLQCCLAVVWWKWHPLEKGETKVETVENVDVSGIPWENTGVTHNSSFLGYPLLGRPHSWQLIKQSDPTTLISFIQHLHRSSLDNLSAFQHDNWSFIAQPTIWPQLLELACPSVFTLISKRHIKLAVVAKKIP